MTVRMARLGAIAAALVLSMSGCSSPPEPHASHPAASIEPEYVAGPPADAKKLCEQLSGFVLDTRTETGDTGTAAAIEDDARLAIARAGFFSMEQTPFEGINRAVRDISSYLRGSTTDGASPDPGSDEFSGLLNSLADACATAGGKLAWRSEND